MPIERGTAAAACARTAVEQTVATVYLTDAIAPVAAGWHRAAIYFALLAAGWHVAAIAVNRAVDVGQAAMLQPSPPRTPDVYPRHAVLELFVRTLYTKRTSRTNINTTELTP